MILNKSDMDELVDSCQSKIGRIKILPFMCAFQEAIYRVTQPFTLNTIDEVMRLSKLRMPEFQKAWQSNRYQVKEEFDRCQTRQKE